MTLQMKEIGFTQQKANSVAKLFNSKQYRRYSIFIITRIYIQNRLQVA